MPNTTLSRSLLFGLAILTLVLDLGSKGWVIGALASGAHPMVVSPAQAPTVVAAFAARSVTAEELKRAATDGLLRRYTPVHDLRADQVVTAAEVGMDLVATEGTGLAAPRRTRIGGHDLGKTLGSVVAEAWRVEPDKIQGVLDHFVLRGAGLVADVDRALPGDAMVALEERSVPVIDRFCTLVYAENFGAAWSFLATAPAMVRHVLFVTITTLACLAMAWVLWTRRMATNASAIALAAILGGALGNLYDRLRFHAVIDFVLNFAVFDGRTVSWPVYNVADIGITVGVIAIILESFLRKPPLPAPQAAAKA